MGLMTNVFYDLQQEENMYYIYTDKIIKTIINRNVIDIYISITSNPFFFFAKSKYDRLYQKGRLGWEKLKMKLDTLSFGRQIEKRFYEFPLR